METEQLQKRAAKLFNYIILCAGVNLLAFLGTALYVAKSQEELAESGLETSDNVAYTAQLGDIKLVAAIGFTVAILAVFLCIPFVLKRAKISREIQQRQLDELDSLDIK